jgi:hypothetical protein
MVAMIAAGVGAAASIGGSMISSGASKSAANDATAAQMNMYNQTRSDLQPFMQGGQNAFSALGNLMGMGGPQASQNMLAGLQNYPGYQFALQQGQQGLDRSAASRGLLLSGGQLKDSMNYNQGMADQLFGTYFNQLNSLASTGENAAAQTGNAGTSAANGMAASMQNAGNAQAGGIMGATNAIAGQNGLISSALSAYQMNNSADPLAPVTVTPDVYGQYSDRRLKKNVRRVGKLDSGLPVYSFEYRGSRIPQIGVMADEVERVAPHLVTRDSKGYRKVNYAGVSRLPPFKEAA